MVGSQRAPVEFALERDALRGLLRHRLRGVKGPYKMECKMSFPKESSVDAERRLSDLYEKMVNPPVTILEINFKKQAETAQRELRKYHHLWWRLYWKRQ